jgi:hypothetical protein
MPTLALQHMWTLIHYLGSQQWTPMYPICSRLKSMGLGTGRGMHTSMLLSSTEHVAAPVIWAYEIVDMCWSYQQHIRSYACKHMMIR